MRLNFNALSPERLTARGQGGQCPCLAGAFPSSGLYAGYIRPRSGSAVINQAEKKNMTAEWFSSVLIGKVYFLERKNSIAPDIKISASKCSTRYHPGRQRDRKSQCDSACAGCWLGLS